MLELRTDEEEIVMIAAVHTALTMATVIRQGHVPIIARMVESRKVLSAHVNQAGRETAVQMVTINFYQFKYRYITDRTTYYTVI